MYRLALLFGQVKLRIGVWGKLCDVDFLYSEARVMLKLGGGGGGEGKQGDTS